MLQYYPTQKKSVYAKRRKALAARVRQAGGGVVIVNSGEEVMRNRDADYPFRSDSYFYYLTGFPEPEACLVMVVDSTSERSMLFCRDKHEEREIWDGYRFGPKVAKGHFGFNAAASIEEITDTLPELLENQPAVHIRLGAEGGVDELLGQAMEAVRAKARMGVTAPRAIIDLTHSLDEMRLIKGTEEQETMRRAARISARAHEAAMLATMPGGHEYEVEAALLYEFRRGGSEFPAYGSIVASGANACVLHYRANNARLEDGDLLLIDAGCELDCYASDITRTFPVNGKFTKAQREVYDIVLAAQDAAISATKPGARFNDPHEAAVKVLAQGLLDLKLLSGSLAEVLESGSYRQFYMHRTGHWLGMDVHDCGSYRDPSAPIDAPAGPLTSRPLQKGMVLTIEPGLYIRAHKSIPEKYRNIGIRIEDDAIVTAKGCEIYTADAPKLPTAIEKLMKQRQRKAA